MISSFIKKQSLKGMGLKQKLLVIESLIFVLPFLTIFYIFYIKKVVLDFSHFSIIASILILILVSLILIRQIFDKVIKIATSLKVSQESDDQLIDIMQDTSELHAIAVSFNQLMYKFEKSTDELKRRTYELFTIKELTESASKSLDIGQMLNLLLEKAMSISMAQIGSALIYNTEKQSFRVVAYKGADGPQKNSYIKNLKPVLQKVISGKQPFFVQNVETDPRTQKQNDPKYKTLSFLSIPIIIKNNVMAVLNLADKENQEIFDSNDEQILSIMIGEIGFALENAMLHLNIKKHLNNLQERSKELTIANEKLQQEIKERKQVEIELQKYKQIISAVQEHILFIDKSYICQAVNNAYLKAYNKEPHEVIGNYLPDIIGPKLFDEHMKDKLDLCLMGKEAQSQFWFDYPVIGKRFMDIIYYPFFEEGNSVTGIVIDARDITNTKNLESQLFNSQKMEAIGTIASGVAHNFNNLLMAIQGNVSLMLLETESKHPNHSMLKNIEKQVESGSDITKQLLGYSKKGKIEIKLISLNQLVKETAETFGKAKKEIRIHLELSDDLFGINADRGQIEQILLNLYLNAVDAMPPELGKYVFLQVTDTGLGISAEIQKHIFEPFFTTKEMGRGTGLGLASVYGIIKGHGGYIDVESEKNKAPHSIFICPHQMRKLKNR
jgi:PAS domain S-box-containing protein